MKRALSFAGYLSAFALLLSTACMQKGGPLKVDSVEPPQGTTGGARRFPSSAAGSSQARPRRR